METYVRTIKYEKELDRSFTKEILSIPGCEGLTNCIQCGTCSGTCPVSIYMDYPPRRIIAMVREGFKDEVLSSKTIWLCASCYACTVECPQNIKITDIMYALKRIAMRERRYPKGFPIPILAKAFFDIVSNKGRQTESKLVMNVWLKISLLKILKNSLFGLKLLRKGKLHFKEEKIKDRESLKLLLEEVKK
ncbi:MAG: 4Fe-4S dicluster domain-containing protein [Candidatus Hydrothermales bacterium]